MQSFIQLSCTVTNNGSFVWDWSGPAVGTGRTQEFSVDTSRTSILNISSISANDSGIYTCTVYYKHSELDLGSLSQPNPLFTAHRTSNNITLSLEGKCK